MTQYIKRSILNIVLLVENYKKEVIQKMEKVANTMYFRSTDVNHTIDFYNYKAKRTYYTIIELLAFTGVSSFVLRLLNDAVHAGMLHALRIYIMVMYFGVLLECTRFCAYKAKSRFLDNPKFINTKYCVSGNTLILKNGWFHIKLKVCGTADMIPVAALNEEKCVLPPNTADNGNVRIVSGHEMLNYSR